MVLRVLLVFSIFIRLFYDANSAPFHASSLSNDDERSLLSNIVEMLGKFIDYKIRNTINFTMSNKQCCKEICVTSQENVTSREDFLLTTEAISYTSVEASTKTCTTNSPPTDLVGNVHSEDKLLQMSLMEIIPQSSSSTEFTTETTTSVGEFETTKEENATEYNVITSTLTTIIQTEVWNSETALSTNSLQIASTTENLEDELMNSSGEKNSIIDEQIKADATTFITEDCLATSIVSDGDLKRPSEEETTANQPITTPNNDINVTNTNSNDDYYFTQSPMKEESTTEITTATDLGLTPLSTNIYESTPELTTTETSSITNDSKIFTNELPIPDVPEPSTTCNTDDVTITAVSLTKSEEEEEEEAEVFPDYVSTTEKVTETTMESDTKEIDHILTSTVNFTEEPKGQNTCELNSSKNDDVPSPCQYVEEDATFSTPLRNISCGKKTKNTIEKCQCGILTPIGNVENKVYIAEDLEEGVQELYVPILKISRKNNTFEFTDYLNSLFAN